MTPWQLVWDVLMDLPWLRRTLFCLVIFVPFLLGWWDWSVAAVLIVLFATYEALDWLLIRLHKWVTRRRT